MELNRDGRTEKAMELELTPSQQALRQDLREYFEALVTPELRQADIGSPPHQRFIRRLGEDGWLGIGWPAEYGGQGRSAIEQMIFFHEVSRADAPFPIMTVTTVGPTVMRFGTDEQKQRFLPPILRGEIQFAIGYTEPSAGTDLASLKTRAVRDGDEYVINGQKAFTSGAEYVDYVWLACRTNPEAPKHEGLSVIIVPTSSPGFSVTPIPMLTHRRTTTTYYDNVRVPVTNRIGEENDGWKLMTNQLNHERTIVGQAGLVHRYLGEVRRWAQSTKLSDGLRVIDQEWVQLNLARVAAKAEYLDLANWHVAWSSTTGIPGPVDASALKVFSSEFHCEAYRLLLEVLGQPGYLKDGSPGSVLSGAIERAYAHTLLATFGGGTNEVQRDLIGSLGLGMPRGSR
jgi:hypothetical protein